MPTHSIKARQIRSFFQDVSKLDLLLEGEDITYKNSYEDGKYHFIYSNPKLKIDVDIKSVVSDNYFHYFLKIDIQYKYATIELMKNFFKTLLPNIIESFKGHHLYFHFLAITLTIVILKSGIDWYYFLAVRDPVLNSIFHPAIAIGFFLPIFIPTTLIILGKIKKNKKASLIGWSLAQAVVIGSVISSTYKAFTGRVEPDLLNLINDSSNSFQFGFWEHGIISGWPSSHTTIAFAMAFVLISVYPKHRILTTVSIIYAFYIGIGVSFAVHWFSEFVSGLIIGTVIGLTVGKSYSKDLK